MLAARKDGFRGLAQLKPDRLVQPKVRKLFPDTAYWSPAVVTGADGRASVSFEFPDALTTWRATARGITEDTRVGAAVERVIVRKNLILRTGYPRFFTEGDEVTLKLVVQNFLTTDKQARVQLEAKGLDLLDGNQRDVKVPAKGEAVAEFRVRAGKAPADAVLLGKALTDEESDAVELTLPVKPFGVKLSQGRAGEGNAEFRLAAPASTVEITVTPSVAGAVFSGLDYLSSFPYGCVEQTMSSFLPNIIVARALADLKLKSDQKPAELDAKIKAGVGRLLDFQHQDGGWGWWQTDDSHPYMTALVVEGFARAAEAGRGTEEMAAARACGAEWLRGAFNRESDAVNDIRAYMAYALTLHDKVNAGLLGRLDKDRLTTAGIAYAGLAAHAAGDTSTASTFARRLETSAKQNEAEAWWESERDSLMGYDYDTSPQATALATKLLSRVNPKNPILSKAARYLVGRRAGGYWISTRQTSDAIDGLTDYLRASGELKPDSRVRVEVDGKNVIDRAFTEADATAATAPVIRVNAPANARIRITKEGSGKVYWSARADWYSAEEKLQKKGGTELSLLREYFRLTPVAVNGRNVYRLEPLEGDVKAGEIIASRLTLTGGDWRYLMIEDPIPAGLELIERDQTYELETRPDWWGWWYTRKELRDDRAALFMTRFEGTQRSFVHLMKVTNAGRFRASAARVQPMYQPDYQATTESKVFEVKPQ